MPKTAGPVAIHYTVEGPAAAPAVTLSHPLGVTSALWDALAPSLAKTYRVIRYDTRGHGFSDVPAGPYTLEQMADDLRRVLDAAGVARTHFVGVSMGGLVGMTAALVAPDRIASLTLCDTTACYGEAMRPMWDERIRVCETVGMAQPMIDKTMEIWFSADFMTREVPVVDRVRRMLRAADPRAYAASVRAIGYVDLRPKIAAIGCPTLVVVGAEDPGTTPAMAREIQARIPGARLVMIPGGRHGAVVEHGAEFERLLGGFLASVT